MRSLRSIARLCASVLLLAGCSCQGHYREAPLAATRYNSTGLGDNPLRGDLVPVHDPSLIHAGDTWYAFTTDLPFTHATTYLPIRCSPDARTWRLCGHVFDSLPAWIHREIPEATGLWAPEIVSLQGRYYLYYAASSLGSQRSGIGVATNTTLDPRSPAYRWEDQGEVLASHPGDDFNAIDAGVLVEVDGKPDSHGAPRAWLIYGSFWSGIKERRIDPATGKLDLQDTSVYALASQPRSRGRAIEGSSLLAHNGYYYLFASVGICCAIPIEHDTYRQIVGRSRSPHGPFVAEDGGRMLDGGGTVLLDSNAQWLAPGGASAYVDPANGEALLTFHALRRSENGALYLWIKRITWQDDWPVLRDP